MKQRLSFFVFALAVLALMGGGSASGQSRGVNSSGTPSGGGGKLNITIETFGEKPHSVAAGCTFPTQLITVPIPFPGDCEVMTDAIFDSLTVRLAGLFIVTEDAKACTVYLQRVPSAGCPYFVVGVDGNWQGMQFTVVDGPTPVEPANWGWLKHAGWRGGLNPDAAERPRR